MTDFRHVTGDFAVSPQIALADLRFAAEQGFALILNNRPDGEASDQPSSALMAAAARNAGLDYEHIPIVGRPTAEQSERMRQAIDAARGKTLAFCRSGTRSITAWAIGQRAAGRMSRAELIERAAGAG
ncbi:MAG: protein tyrosine phosphatase family protein, partial [Caulobacteraceae bacterium]